MNPFLTNFEDQPFGRAREIEEIRKRVDARSLTAIQGVEGIGKTAILKAAFDRDFRIQKAREKVLISAVTEFPPELKDDEIYQHFTDTVIKSVRILSLCDAESEMNAILSECEQLRTQAPFPASAFESVIEAIHFRGYHIVIVVDNFERFTTSYDVTLKHHETLRRMLSMSQYIVATNYDLNQDSLPKEVSSSLYMMNFSGHELLIGGWSYLQTEGFIKEQLKNSTIQFSPALCDKLYGATGGIPKLVKWAGQYAYDYIEKNGSEDGLQFVALYNDQKVQTLLQHWSRMFSKAQIAELKKLLTAQQNPLNKMEDAVLTSLQSRGILTHVQQTDAYGNTIIKDNEYQFCCKYFGKFCSDGNNLEDAAKQNPLLNPPQKALAKHLTFEELADELMQRLENDDLTPEQLYETTHLYAQHRQGLTHPLDINEEPSEEVLAKYYLSKEIMNQLDPTVQQFLRAGINMDRMFEGVDTNDLRVVYLNFCTAVELHLNLTILPAMKMASPDTLFTEGAKTCRLCELPDNKHLPIGTLFYVFAPSGHKGGISEDKVIDTIKLKCLNIRSLYPDEWWDNFGKIGAPSAKFRNSVAHPNEPVDDAAGKAFLKTWLKYDKTPKKSLMMGCIKIYEEIKRVCGSGT